MKERPTVKKTEAELLSGQWDPEHMETDPATLERYVRYEVDPERSLATIIFDRPDLMNALPVAALERIGDLVREAEVDDRVKVILFRGEGPCFGTGADGNELGHYIGYKSGTDATKRKRPPQRTRILPDRNVLYNAFQRPIEQCLKATICQVHSYCYGGHMQIALAADIVIATPDAQFTHPAFRYLGPGPQDMYLWIENLGLKKMKDLMLTMRPIGAHEAEDAGFVTRVVEYDELEQWVGDYIQAIATMPIDSLMMGKAMMNIIMEARGKSIGAMTCWVGHGWATNVAFEEGDWNFLKERREKGLTEALRERDAMVAPFFRLGKTRDQNGARPAR
jgi:enoyl-CoA hydratase